MAYCNNKPSIRSWLHEFMGIKKNSSNSTTNSFFSAFVADVGFYAACRFGNETQFVCDLLYSVKPQCFLP